MRDNKTYFVDEDGSVINSIEGITNHSVDQLFFRSWPKGIIYTYINGGWRWHKQYGGFTLIASEDLPKIMQMQLLTGAA